MTTNAILPQHTTIYRYGSIAWVWRGLIAIFLVLGILILGISVHFKSLKLVPAAVVLLTPAIFFGAALATQIDRIDDSHVKVWTLLFWRRQIPYERLGLPRLRLVYHGRGGPVRAPAIWVPVRRSLPIYVDLMGEIPNRKVFDVTFRLGGHTPPRGQHRR